MKKILLSVLSIFVGHLCFSQTILEETFDGSSMPDGWDQTSNNPYGWEFGSPGSLSSTYWTIPAHDGNCSAANDDAHDNNSETNDASMDYLMTPSLDFSAYSSVLLTFDIFYNGAYGSTGDLEISTDGGDTFTEIMDFSTSDSWQSLNVNLNEYVAETDVVIAFHHDDNGAWADGLAVDNVVIFSPESNNAALSLSESEIYVPSNSNVSIEGEILNVGANNVTSVVISWSAGDQNGSTTVDGLNLEPFESASFSHPDQLEIDDENIEVTVSIDQVNGESDPNMSDNTAMASYLAMLFFPDRKVLLEQATGTWCTWCPRGHVFSDYMEETYPNAIAVAVHNSDPMANATYDNGIGDLIGGYPSGLVDRVYNDIDPSEFEEYYLQRMEDPAIVEVSVQTEYNASTRDLMVNVDASFAINTTGDYRINAIIVENNITGTSSGYAQVNSYSGGQFGPMGGYEDLPNPVPASQMVYDHVGRRIFGGWDGTAQSIPGTIVAGESYTQDYSHTLPGSWDDSEIMVIGVVIDQNTGEIVNANEVQGILSTENLLNAGFDFRLYPSPAVESTNVALDLTEAGDIQYHVYDLAGKQVLSQSPGRLTPGKYLHTLDVSNLKSGIYIVTILKDGYSVSKKLSVK